jgi:hypothetical protein
MDFQFSITILDRTPDEVGYGKHRLIESNPDYGYTGEVLEVLLSRAHRIGRVCATLKQTIQERSS